MHKKKRKKKRVPRWGEIFFLSGGCGVWFDDVRPTLRVSLEATSMENDL